MSAGNIGFLPVAMLQEPYAQPLEPGGESPYGRDAQTVLDGTTVTGSGWNADWRGETFVPDTYQGFGAGTALPAGGQPTSWSPYSGRVDTDPMIAGYSGRDDVQTRTAGSLRAGSTIGFPTSGQMDPGFDPVLIEIPFDSGNDVGWQQWWQQGRRMLFEEPLNYSQQTQATPAIGWP